jgi:hypothetical protein
MFIAFIASKEGSSSDGIWMAAALIGIAGVIGGSVLAYQHIMKDDKPATVASLDEKPAYDPDEFDVVGRRG